MSKSYDYYRDTLLGEECTLETHCEDCDALGICETCDTVKGIWAGSDTFPKISGDDGIFGRANTCDGCMDLTALFLLHMDPETQLAYCDYCMSRIDPEIRARIETFEAAGQPQEMINSHPVQLDPDTIHYNPATPMIASALIPE